MKDTIKLSTSPCVVYKIRESSERGILLNMYMMMIMGLLLKLFLSWLLLLNSYPAVNAAVELSGVRRGCNSSCGNLVVPYPFGIGVECAANPGLYITCNYSYTPPIPFILENVEIMSISDSEVRTKNFVSYECHNQSGKGPDSLDWSFDLSEAGGSYTFSDKRNKFISVGCNTIALFRNIIGNYSSGCVSLCGNESSIVNGSCSGWGCCQTSIPKMVTYFEVRVTSARLDAEDRRSRKCNYAFLGDLDEYTFQSSDLTDRNFLNRTEEHVPVVLDWVIRNHTCEEAQRDRTTYACQSNSACIDSHNAPGYRCICRRGYEGNPYLEPGCQEIDECADRSKNKCVASSSCVNTQCGYTCTCPRETYGDGREDGQGCKPIPKNNTERITKNSRYPTTKIILGIGLGILFLLIGIFFLYVGLKERRLAKLKKRFFKQNGGLLLQQNQQSLHESGGGTRIYTAEELRKATNNYDESQIIGRGGNGTVYKGVLPPDNKIIAIKKSKVVDKTQIEQFINEVVILAQINHKNVVKLLGCCLETEVPLLVYEFISNGTLYHHIHSRPDGGIVSSKFSWYNCLRIATEISRALAYLHSAASIPIIHRDVKSTNILLDDNYSAKVADFGASRLIPLDQTQVSTIVQGTLGYLDPESYQTGKLTDKSDVYSFGVVLIEILTGKTPLSFERNDVCRSLATYFMSAMKENALFQIVDDRLVDEMDGEQIRAVADLAMRCLTWKGEERPTMKEVLEELEGLMKLVEQHPWAEENTEETIRLLDDQSSDLYPRATFSLSIGKSSDQNSMNLNNSLMSPLNLPR